VLSRKKKTISEVSLNDLRGSNLSRSGLGSCKYVRSMSKYYPKSGTTNYRIGPHRTTSDLWAQKNACKLG